MKISAAVLHSFALSWLLTNCYVHSYALVVLCLVCAPHTFLWHSFAHPVMYRPKMRSVLLTSVRTLLCALDVVLTSVRPRAPAVMRSSAPAVMCSPVRVLLCTLPSARCNFHSCVVLFFTVMK